MGYSDLLCHRYHSINVRWLSSGPCLQAAQVPAVRMHVWIVIQSADLFKGAL